MKRILFFVESLGGGGAEKVLVDLVNHMDPACFHITLVVMTSGGVWDHAAANHVDLRFLLRREDFAAGGWRGFGYRLRHQMLRRLPPRLVHFLFFHERNDAEIAFTEGLATRLIAAAPRKSRRLAWVHTDFSSNAEGSDGAFRSPKTQRRAYAKFDRILCVSQRVRDQFIAKLGALPQLTVQYNPVDAAAVRARAEEKTAFPPGRGMTLLAVGRFSPVKGMDRLLRICARLRDEGLEFRLWLLGDGAQRGALEEYIRAASLQDCVALLGFRQNPYPFLRTADCLVSASRAEGLSTAAAEALILGTPVVCTDCAGMREVLGGMPCGILAQNSEEGLCQALRELLRQPSRLEGMRAAALARGAQFSLEERMKEITAHILGAGEEGQ
ncbi:MAG: glycosyltransferase [Oscillospiraceae bacterium]|nr:glycosyltransferase [Oscillospiraceae bacterium]